MIFTAKRYSYIVVIYQLTPILCLLLPLHIDAPVTNWCQSRPCKVGVCEDFGDHYKCYCYPGWTGVHCEIGKV